MKRRAFVFGVLGVGAVVAAVAARGVRAEAAPSPARRASPGATPVLVELFTSEGCSSCPPADAVLAGLERAQPVDGVEIVPVAFHVDYWDGIGWPDPFARPAWTARQRAYGVLGGGLYTPQAVIDGRAETVGSRRAALELAVARAAKAPRAKVAIDVERAGDAFDVFVRVGALPGDAAGDAEVVLVVTQADARVAVPRGENAGRTLEHTAIARELLTLGPAPAGGAVRKSRVRAPTGISPAALRVVAFVEERASRRVLGVATRPLDAR